MMTLGPRSAPRTAWYPRAEMVEPGAHTRTQREVESGDALGSLPKDALEQPYLAVFEQSSQSILALPVDGEVVIGRGDEAGLVLRDSRVSRAHAKLVVGVDGTLLVDLGSQNGTRVGGVALSGSRRLVSGDVIEIGGAALVFHNKPPPLGGGSDLEFDDFRQRVEREVERAALTGRSFGVLALGTTDERARELSLEVSKRIQRLDAFTAPGSGPLLVLLVERSAEEIQAWLSDLAPVERIGVALYPQDASDADSLVAGARAAQVWSDEGGVSWAADAARTIELGEQQVLVADPAMLRVYELLSRIALSDLAVLIEGETGTGKELAALALHAYSPRRERRLVVLNCAALTETLVESELFGHVKGAFTGAGAHKTGLLEVAEGGSVLLDEIGELPLGTQAKLLRALGTKRITRIGDTSERSIDVRVVAATNRSLNDDAKSGRFRSDLFYRLSGAIVWLPPLRHRPRELALLARRFLADECQRLGRRTMQLSAASMDRLARHDWAGNVRELKNVMEFCAAAFDVPVLEPWHLGERLQSEVESPSATRDEPTPKQRTREARPGSSFRPLDDEIRELERQRIEEALAETEGNQRRAAELLGIPLRTFATKLNQYGLRRGRQ